MGIHKIIKNNSGQGYQSILLLAHQLQDTDTDTHTHSDYSNKDYSNKDYSNKDYIMLLLAATIGKLLGKSKSLDSCKVNAGKGTYRAPNGASLCTPSGFAIEARCKRLKAALRANLKY